MESFDIYIIKSSIAISLLYGFYWIFLRNETYHSWNRIFLLISLMISFVFPMFSYSIQKISTGTLSNIIESVTISGLYKPALLLNTYNSLSILSIIYISGAVFFCLRFLSSLTKLYFLYLRFPKNNLNGFKAVILDSDQSPFTFFNILFISRNDYEMGKMDSMIVHEKAHKEDYHSFDIILLEVMTIIQWFNPFIWLFRYTLKSEHEFIADNKVLLEGFDKVKYKKLLFEKSLGITSFNLTNNFNYSLLKKRLKMMAIKKSSSLVRIKYLLSMPILLVTIMLLVINFSSYGQKDKIYDVVDVMAKYKNGDISGVREFIMHNITYPKSAQDNKICAKIFVQFVIDEKGKVTNVEIARSDILDNKSKEVVVVGYESGTNPEINSKSVADLEAEAIRVIKLLSDLTPAQKDGKNVKTQYTFPINFILKEKKELKPTSQ